MADRHVCAHVETAHMDTLYSEQQKATSGHMWAKKETVWVGLIDAIKSFEAPLAEESSKLRLRSTVAQGQQGSVPSVKLKFVHEVSTLKAERTYCLVRIVSLDEQADPPLVGGSTHTKPY